MSDNGILIDEAAYDYLQALYPPEDAVLSHVRQRSASHRRASMATSAETVRVLVWLTRLIQAQHYLELGVFTGYSSTAIASALPENGKAFVCDINQTHLERAAIAWQEAKIQHKITVFNQPALITLRDLANDYSHFFDLIYIDADKLPLRHYFEASLPLARVGGLIVIDNILCGGRIASGHFHESETLPVVDALNKSWAHDARVDPLFLPLGDAIAVLRKKSVT